MEASETEPSSALGHIQSGNRSRVFRSSLFFVLLCLVLALQMAIIVIGFWQLKSVKRRLDDLEFSDAVNDYEKKADFVSPSVGVIQFLRRGYSIVFDSATYNQDGLVLSGTIANPSQLVLNSLTLNFSARPFPVIAHLEVNEFEQQPVSSYLIPLSSATTMCSNCEAEACSGDRRRR